MTISNPDVLKGYYNVARAMGDKSINSMAWFEISGFEEMALLTKQFPWPTIGPGGEIEIAGPMGIKLWQPQQIRVNQQGQLVFTETTAGHVSRFLRNVVKQKAVFQATVYEGTPSEFHRAYRLHDCFFQPDNADRDWENQAAITQIAGTLFYHHFGEEIPGNLIASI